MSSRENSIANRIYGISWQVASAIWYALMTILWKLAYKDNSYLTGFDYLIVRSWSMLLTSIYFFNKRKSIPQYLK